MKDHHRHVEVGHDHAAIHLRHDEDVVEVEVETEIDRGVLDDSRHGVGTMMATGDDGEIVLIVMQNGRIT